MEQQPPPCPQPSNAQRKKPSKSYISDEERAELLAKYGKLKPPPKAQPAMEAYRAAQSPRSSALAGGARPTTALPSTSAAPLPPRPTTAPRPVSARGQPTRYVSDDALAALNAKYGKLQKPSAQDMEDMANSGCRQQ